MPITVTCPSCASSFGVKDEYAGKRAKCPKCAEPLTVPAATAPPPAAAPVVARPVVAARVPPKPTEDEDDDRPKRKRGADDEDDAPVSPKRKRGDRDDDEDAPTGRKRKRGADDDADDDAPKKRRRDDDDDDEPKKKSKALPIILGVLGGLVLVCGGSCASLWIFFIGPAMESAKAMSSKFSTGPRIGSPNTQSNPTAPQPATETITEANMGKLRAGMTLAEVRAILGNESKMERFHLMASTGGTGDPTMFNRWSPKQEAGHCGRWEKLPNKILVAFSGPLDAAGTVKVVGVIGEFRFATTEPVKLPGGKPENETLVAVTADQLADGAKQYVGQRLLVSGTVAKVTDIPGGTGWVQLATAGKPITIMAIFPRDRWTPGKIKAGDMVQVKGDIGSGPNLLEILSSELVQHQPGAAPPVGPTAPLSPADVLKDVSKYQGQSVAVRGKVKLTFPHVDGDKGSIVFETGDSKINLIADFPPGKWRKDFIRGGEDTIEVRGKLSGLMGNPGTGQHFDIQDCDLVKRTDKDGKDVPLPPVTPANKPVGVTAEALAAEFAKDATAAAKKYTDKSISVSGTIVKVLSTGTKVTLTGQAAEGGKKAFVVEVTMDNDQTDAAKKLKDGDQVTLTGKYRSFLPQSSTALNRVGLTGGVIEK